MILLLCSLVYAEDLVPAKGTASLVRASDGGGVYYPLDDGGSLDFAVVGPIQLDVEVRQRLPEVDSPLGEVKLSAKGDGMHILTVKVSSGVDETGMVMDSRGGVPTLADQAQITVPAGEHVFTLSYTEGENPVLVRVSVERTMPTPPVAEPELDEPPVGEPVVEEPVVEEPVLAEPEEPVIEEPEEPVIEEPEQPQEPVLGEPEEPAEQPEQLPQPMAPYEPELGQPVEAAPSLAAGVRLGLGDTRAGNRASLYAGLELRKPLTDSLGLSVRLGRYGSALDTEVAIQPAIGQYAGITQHVAWKTRVRQADLALRTSRPLGPVTGSAQAGVALYHATRVHDEEKVRGVSAGLTWALGVELDLLGGTVAPELAFHTGRRSFGNPAAGGEEARESLAGAHLNVAYLVSF